MAYHELTFGLTYFSSLERKFAMAYHEVTFGLTYFYSLVILR